MKKIIICLGFIAFFSCDKEDNNYVIRLQDVCPNGSNPVSHCVSKSTYETVKASSAGSCARVNFKDVDGNSRSGYYAGSSSGMEDCY